METHRYGDSYHLSCWKSRGLGLPQDPANDKMAKVEKKSKSQTTRRKIRRDKKILVRVVTRLIIRNLSMSFIRRLMWRPFRVTRLTPSYMRYWKVLPLPKVGPPASSTGYARRLPSTSCGLSFRKSTLKIRIEDLQVRAMDHNDPPLNKRMSGLPSVAKDRNSPSVRITR